jgi:uridine monophosphate synthetase
MIEQLVLDLFAHEIIKFGEFTLKSGKKSFIYADIRSVIAYPPLFTQMVKLLFHKMQGLNYNLLCGVPYAALTLASAIAYAHQIPLILKRKEAKNYGTKKLIEGVYHRGDQCVIIEDVVTTGLSIGETTQALEQVGIKVSDVICFLERNQGGRENLAAQGYTLHSIIDLYQLCDILQQQRKISSKQMQQALASIGE